MYEAAFRDLRKLADWLQAGSDDVRDPGVQRLLRRLGAAAIPLLCRELCSVAPARRDAARDALEVIAGHTPELRARVIAELRAITEGAAPDEAKVVALGLLGELGEHADVRFSDPAAIRRRSAIALASHLETAADVASAADLMVHQLEANDILQMLEAMSGAAPDAARTLAGELAIRIDLPAELRDRIALIAATVAAAAGPPRAALREPAEPPRVAVLVDAAARLVVVAGQRSTDEPRWRRWAVLIGASGRIDDCLHEEDAGPHGSTGALSAALCADGYRVASSDLEHARSVVAAAARRTAESTRTLPSSYYLGRDLLALADAHTDSGRGDPASAALARAVELIAAGDAGHAIAVLAHCDPDHPDAAAALATALLGQHRPSEAVTALERALAAEPDWPLHHWNLAVALRQLGDDRGCYHALERFVATSAVPSGLAGDPDQPGRITLAHRMLGELARAAWWTESPRPPGAPRSPRARSQSRRSKRGTGAR